MAAQVGRGRRRRRRRSSSTVASRDVVNPFRKSLRLQEHAVQWLLVAAASFAVVVSIAILYILVVGSVDFFADPRITMVEFLMGTEWVLRRRFGLA